MQKKLIAVAVAGLVSGAAFAQSNVTISGIADVYVGRISNDGYKSFNAVNSGGLSGSRFAINGAEDLGNGLKAIFQLEQGVDMTDNGGWNGTRQAYVGLAGSFGAVVAGRLQTPGYYVGKFDALASAGISPQAILATGPMIGGAVASTIAPSNNARLNSAVAYLSPNFGGFSAIVAGSTSNYASESSIAKSCQEVLDLTTPANSKACSDESAWALALNYEAGPVSVGFVHHDIQNYAGYDVFDAQENMIGASYDFKVVKVLGSYQTAKLKDTDTNKMYQIGVVVPVGAGNIHVATGKLDTKNETLGATSSTIAYTYALSKRTTAYAGYNVTSNKSHETLGVGRAFAGTSTLNGILAGYTGYAVDAGGKATALVAGVRHSF